MRDLVGCNLRKTNSIEGHRSTKCPHLPPQTQEDLNTLRIYPTNTEKIWIHPQTSWSLEPTQNWNDSSKQSVSITAPPWPVSSPSSWLSGYDQRVERRFKVMMSLKRHMECRWGLILGKPYPSNQYVLSFKRKLCIADLRAVLNKPSNSWSAHSTLKL